MGENRVTLSVIAGSEAEAHQELEGLRKAIVEALQEGGPGARARVPLPQEIRHQPEEQA